MFESQNSEQYPDGWHRHSGLKQNKHSVYDTILVWWVFYLNGEAIKSEKRVGQHPINKEDPNTEWRHNMADEIG